MNRTEAIEAMIRGEKITGKAWNGFIHIKLGKLVTNSDVSVLVSLDDFSGYEIYQEPKKKVKWYRVACSEKGCKVPYSYQSLWRGLDEFFNENNTTQSDYHWINIELVCEQDEV